MHSKDEIIKFLVVNHCTDAEVTHLCSLQRACCRLQHEVRGTVKIDYVSVYTAVFLTYA